MQRTCNANLLRVELAPPEAAQGPLRAIDLRMFGFGVWEIGIVLALVVLLFGGKKIPELARGLGQGIREFRRAKDELEDDRVRLALDTDHR